MNPGQNKLMPYLQAFAAALILICFFAVLFLVLLIKIDEGGKEIAMPMIEVLKNIVLLLVGFLFGTSVSSAKKDDTIAVQAASLAPVAPVEPAVK